MHRAKGDRLVCASMLPVCDNVYYPGLGQNSYQFSQNVFNGRVRLGVDLVQQVRRTHALIY